VTYGQTKVTYGQTAPGPLYDIVKVGRATPPPTRKQLLTVTPIVFVNSVVIAISHSALGVTKVKVKTGE
jgi:hypothetical protein